LDYDTKNHNVYAGRMVITCGKAAAYQNSLVRTVHIHLPNGHLRNFVNQPTYHNLCFQAPSSWTARSMASVEQNMNVNYQIKKTAPS